MDRKVKIVATIGPTSQSEQTIEQLLRVGMDVARLNFSHGTHAEHLERLQRLRILAARVGNPLMILQDLQGPKIRVGVLPTPIPLKVDDRVLLFSEKIPAGDGKSILVEFPELFQYINPGTRILLDDGRIVLEAESVSSGQASARVVCAGILSSHKGINLPGVQMDISAFTAKDAIDLEFGLTHKVDAVAMSFVRSAQDIEIVQRAIKDHSSEPYPLLIAKIERPEALSNLEAILDVADGVMVARGDLGVEMNPEDVPGAQKRIIQAANRKGKSVITATQMLESMIHNPLPTRAEASDVANAVFDGTDAVMLSGETAAGDYPVESLAMMGRIVRQAEAGFMDWGHTVPLDLDNGDDAVAMTHAVRELAHDRDVTAIAVFTRGGRSAWMMAKSRPCVPILAFTPEETTYHRLALAWGVQPHIVPFADTVEAMIGHVEQSLQKSGIVKSGQQVIIVCGFPVGKMCPPNMALLHSMK